MNAIFYIAAAVAVISTGLAISRANAVHALLYLIVSLLSVALIFFTIGAPFVGALEIIVYAGAIMVLFVFVVMLLNLDERSAEQERRWIQAETWFVPFLLALVLIGELIYVLARGGFQSPAAQVVGAKQVGIALFGPYLLAVELASMMLLSGLIGAYHLGRRDEEKEGEIP